MLSAAKSSASATREKARSISRYLSRPTSTRRGRRAALLRLPGSFIMFTKSHRAVPCRFLRVSSWHPLFFTLPLPSLRLGVDPVPSPYSRSLSSLCRAERPSRARDHSRRQDRRWEHPGKNRDEISSLHPLKFSSRSRGWWAWNRVDTV